MLTIIEHKEDLPVSQIGNQSLDWVFRLNGDAERRRDRANDMQWVGDWPEIDEPDAVVERPNESVGDRDRDGRLANSSWSDDRNEAVLRQSCCKRYDRIGSPHNATERRGQLALLNIWNACLRRGKIRSGRLNWGHEAISPTGNIGDESGAVLPIAQRLAKRSDVEFEISLFYELFGPNTGKKLLLRDHRPRALKERGENFVRSASQPNGLFAFQEKPLVTKETERPKRKLIWRMRFGFGHRSSAIGQPCETSHGSVSLLTREFAY